MLCAFELTVKYRASWVELPPLQKQRAVGTWMYAPQTDAVPVDAYFVLFETHVVGLCNECRSAESWGRRPAGG
jgi:hypothetical protein